MIVHPRHTHAAARRLLGAVLATLLLLTAAPLAGAASGGATISSSSKSSATKAKGASTTTKGTRPKPVGKAQVKRAQLLLRVYASGKHDDATRKTVKRFQELRGLPEWGIVDLPTYLEIKNAFALLETGGVTIESASAGGGATTETPAFKLPENLAPISARERAILDKIAQCESKGDPTAVSSSGLYRGKYQFDRATWKTVGGTGDPAAATEDEQDQRAAILLRRRGVQPWPVCGRGLL